MAAARPSNILVINPTRRRARGGDIVVETGEPEADGRRSATVDVDGGITVTYGTPAKPAPSVRSKAFDHNLAEDIDASALDALAGYLLEGIEADKESRRDWLDTADMAAKYLGIKLQEPASAVSPDGTVCQTIATCLLEANVKLWSTARAELLPVGGPVKVRRDDLQPGVPRQQQPSPAMGHNGGPPMDGAQGPGVAPPAEDPDNLATALEQDLNWYLTVGDREYYPDFSRMLRARALIGNAFRKVFRDPVLRKPVSRWVKAQNLIVSNDCTHLSGAGRITEYIPMRQSRMKRMQKLGFYLDVMLVQPSGEASSSEEAVAEVEGVQASPQLPADMEHVVYECRTEISSAISVFGSTPDLELLDRDENGREPGFPLPYRVSIDRDSRKVLEIRRNWKKDDTDYVARRSYVRYGFIPGEGFYDFGLIHMAGNPTQAATMIQRATVDSTLYANFPGGMYAKGVGSLQTNTVLRPGPGEWIPVPVAGAQKIADVFLPNPYKPPTPEALQIEQKFEADVKRLAGVIEIPVGEGRVGNTPVGTMMSYIEAVSQVPGAVHKDDHITQAEEYELLRELLAEDPEVLTRGNRSPARKWQIASEITDPDLVPAADPNTPSAVHRLMKLQAMVTLGGLPQFNIPVPIANNRAIYEHAMLLLASGSPQEFSIPPPPPQAAPPPPPDPRIVAAGIKAQADQAKSAAQLQGEQIKAQSHAADLTLEGQQRDADRQSAETRAAMSLEQARIKTEADQHTATADRMHDAAQQGADRIQSHAQHLDTMKQSAQQFSAPFSEPQE